MIKHIAIIAGGLATRLGPLATNTPKSMIEVAGKPFIAHQLALLRHRGFADVVLCVGYLGEKIEQYVGNGTKWGLNVKYSRDGNALLGTGGALQKALPLLPEAFFILYGDSYLNVRYKSISDAFETQKKFGLMTVYKNTIVSHANNVLFEDGKILKYDKVKPTAKMQHIDYGLNILTKKAFKAWQDMEWAFDLSDVFTRLITNGELAGFEVDKRFYEIGSVKGLEETERYLKGR
jgi:NDP-sugar pyrophosphorylase family protein